jgi:hypothetical protein
VLHNKILVHYIQDFLMMHVNQLLQQVVITVGYPYLHHNNVQLEFVVIQLIIQMKLIVHYILVHVDIMDQFVLMD